MEHKINRISYLELSTYFSVDKSTGILSRIKSIGNAPLGSVGYNNGVGYKRVYFKGKHHLVHQIVWRLTHRRDIPEDSVVDHIDRDSRNNRPSNLRLLSSSDNKLNGGTYCTNTTGKRGVTFHKGKGIYESTITVDKKRFWLGRFAQLKDAVQARTEAENFYGKGYLCQSR